MKEQFSVTLADRDPDYLGLKIYASSSRFAATTRVYASLDELSAFCRAVADFPRDASDERRYVFGSRDRGVAGGYCSLHFICINHSGHVRLEVEIDDDAPSYPKASCQLSLSFEPAELDDFCRQLKTIEEGNDRRSDLKKNGEPEHHSATRFARG